MKGSKRMIMMALGMVFLLFLLVSMSSIACAGALSPNEVCSRSVENIPPKRVAVWLEIAGDYINGVDEWLIALVESRLEEAGWDVLARRGSYQALLDEQNLPGLNQETVAPQNQHYGATALVDLTARATVNRLGGGLGLQFGETTVNLGSWVTCRFRLIGRVVDVRTGRISPVAVAGSHKGSLESLGLYAPGNSFLQGGAIYNDNIQQSLAYKAADAAVEELVKKLNQLYPQVPSQESWPAANH